MREAKEALRWAVHHVPGIVEYFMASSENYRRAITVLNFYMRRLRSRNIRGGCPSDAIRRAGICAWVYLRQAWMSFN